MTRVAVDWQQETKIYQRPHPRLAQMARLIRSLPHRRILDVGCLTGMLGTLLPADFDYYGCDVADHAGKVLAPGHFRRIDFNQSADLSFFRDANVGLISIGGVLEYLERPQELLRAARNIVAPGGHLAVTIINFESQKFSRPSEHHPGWIYKPRLDELRETIAHSGWAIQRQMPFFGQRPLRRWLASAWGSRLGVDHPLTRRRADQFILLAQAV